MALATLGIEAWRSGYFKEPTVVMALTCSCKLVGKKEKEGRRNDGTSTGSTEEKRSDRLS